MSRLRLICMMVAAVLTATPAQAQNGKVKKAQKAFSAFQAGERESLADAWEAIGPASAHKKTEGVANTWMLSARIAMAYANNPDISSPVEDPAKLAVQHYRRAADLDTARTFSDEILEQVIGLENLNFQAAMDARESKDLEEAWERLAMVFLCQELVVRVGQLDPRRELATRKMAVLVAVGLGRVEEAMDHHEELLNAGGFHAPTTLMVAEALEQAEGPDSALDFLEPVQKRRKKEPGLVERRARLMLKAGRPEDAEALMDERAPQLIGRDLGTTVSFAHMYESLGSWEKADKTFGAAIDFDPRNLETLADYADVLEKRAAAAAAAAGEESDWRRKGQLKRVVTSAYRRAVEVRKQAVEIDPYNLDNLRGLEALYEVSRLGSWSDKKTLKAQLEEALKAAPPEAIEDAPSNE